MPGISVRVTSALSIFIVVFLCLVSCTPPKKTNNVTGRTYRMGFQNSAPSTVFSKDLQALDMWTQRADAAIISTQVPWDSLYNGETPQQYVQNNYSGLVTYYRGKGLKLWVYIDPANGLNRATDATDLAALGKSISQPAVQNVYQRFCVVMDSMLKPDHFGFALETNLIRDLSPDSIYNGVKTAAAGAAAAVRAIDANVKLSISIQADWAWGVANNTAYKGIATDLADFPFIQELGISSYPYFCFNQASDIPSTYYSRLLAGSSLPVFISEGGWSSQTVGIYSQTPQKQQDYITYQGQLLASVNAIAYFQLTFTDINTNALPPGIPSNIDQFAYIGLVDTNLQAKSALAAWDALYAKPLAAGH